MPWKECVPMDLRYEFVQLASGEGANIASLCRRFGISRKTGYKWLDRFKTNGHKGLADRSRRPLSSPYRCTHQVEAAVLALRAAHPAWGGRKIHHALKRRGMTYVPCPSTISRILTRHNLIDPKWTSTHGPWKRFERTTPNDLWQIDFKGEWRTQDQLWCYPLTATDDCTRFNIILQACTNQKRLTVRACLIQAFSLYGVPLQILMDNGTPWSTSRVPGGWTKLTAWMLRLDIHVLHGRPYHPQTQGKEERFHRTLKIEVLQDRQFLDANHVQQAFDEWREVYNHQRPHQALDYQVPSDRYHVGKRDYPQELPPIVYDHGETVRKVNRVGQISYRGKTYKLSEAFAGQPVALRPTREDAMLDVIFVRQAIGRLDIRNAVVVARPGPGRSPSCELG